MKKPLQPGRMPLVLLVFFLYPGIAQGQTTTPVEIDVHEGTALEEKGREQLRRILATYDLDPWIFTRAVVIQSRVIPHSHPVLTLNTRYVDDDVVQLSTFLHEQIHWFADADSLAVERAVADLRQRYPAVPVRGGEGARSEFSTYLHLIVCWLERDAMTHGVGEELARKTLSAMDHYKWIYGRVLEEGAAIGDIVKRHNLLILPPE